MRSSKSLGDSSLVLPSGVSVLFSNFNVFTAWNFVQVHGLYTQYFLIYIIRRLNDNEFLFFSEWPIEHVYCTFTNTFLVECLLNMHPYWLDNTSYRPNKLETVLSHFTNMFNSETRRTVKTCWYCCHLKWTYWNVTYTMKKKQKALTKLLKRRLDCEFY